MQLAARLAQIQPFHVMSILERAKRLEQDGHDIIHLEIGEPDFPTPAPIVAAAQSALSRGETFYTAAMGLPALREAIAGWYRDSYRHEVDPARICVTPGASGALLIALALLAEPGRSVLLPDPTYPCNRHLVSLLDAEPVSVPVDAASRYQLSAADIDAHWREDSVAAMIASPANPTGTLITPDALADLHRAVAARAGTLIVDEIYHGLTYGCDAPTALAQSDDIFVINSFSKYFQMTGWRLGWLVVPDAYIAATERLMQNLFLAAPTLSQHAALAAFAPETVAGLELRRSEFARRRDALLATLAPLGFRFPAIPEGAFYLYADVSALTDDSFAFARDLLEQAHVAVAPGRDFSLHDAERYVRLAYTCDTARLAEAGRRIAGFVDRRN
ncbi:pyridoxal phosphate-dependent aminotransferase [Microvirgula aerodenitrificans]|uniref:pyridoxal phosphate-dependent aminotransferase n=1 Tax=Microvirgula aerodenitrificans TaxID=57480 RepID=UPI0028ECACE4|nr:pyridoxal phosphate-dependent aminotransferase [Microvirgula aerodenitrificans]